MSSEMSVSSPPEPGPARERPQADSSGPARPGLWRSWKFWLVVALIVAAALAVGIPWYLHALHYVSTDDAFIDGHIIPIGPRVPGHVIEVHVADNELVSEGDLLVRLDPRDFQVRLEQALAAMHSADTRVAAARAQLAQAEANVQAAIALARQAEAEVNAAQAVAQRSDSDLKRYAQLIKTGTVTQQEYEHAQTTAQGSTADLQAARRKVAAAEAQVVATRTTVEASQQTVGSERANFSQAQAAVQQAQLQLSYTDIHATCGGYVTNKTVQVGAYVQVGQTLMTIVPANLWVTANFKETDLTNMQPGQPVSITIDAYPEATFAGLVDSIQRGTGARFSLLPPENATGYFIKVVQRVPVKIIFDEQPDLRRYHIGPGMSVQPTVNISAKPRRVPARPTALPAVALPPLPPVPALTTNPSPAAVPSTSPSASMPGIPSGLNSTADPERPGSRTGSTAP